MNALIRTAICASLMASSYADGAYALEFEVVGDKIYAEGEIVKGDTRRFFEGEGVDIRSDAGRQYTVYLNSIGGNLLEGVELGRQFKLRSISTHVAQDSICLSACSFAFLGGTFKYATGEGPGRQIEWGANLGFHGYSLNNEVMEVANETLSASRALNALLIDFSQQVGDIDYAWISKALTYPPESMYYANTPSSFEALSILVLGGPSEPPENWDKNLCDKLMYDLGYRNGRDLILDYYSTVKTISEIRKIVANPVLARYEISSKSIKNDFAINLAYGAGFNIEAFKPILDARARALERGAGFYYDSCVSFRSQSLAVSALVDSVNGSIRWVITEDRYPVSNQNAIISMFPKNSPLW